MSPKDITEGIGDILDTPYAVDFDKLNSVSTVVMNVIGFILGFAAIFIVVFITLMTTLDILYLTVPMFRSFVHEKNWDGSNDTKRFRLISSDARVSVEEMAIDSGKPPIVTYCKKRIKTYLICAIIFTIITVYQNDIMQLVRSVVLKVLEGTGLFGP